MVCSVTPHQYHAMYIHLYIYKGQLATLALAPSKAAEDTRHGGSTWASQQPQQAHPDEHTNSTGTVQKIH